MKSLIKKLLSLEIIKFLFAGGINTLMGSILIPYVYNMLFGEQIWFTFLSTNVYWGLFAGYLLWLIPAFFIQLKVVFKSRFEWPRFLVYPLTQIPNFIINSFFYNLFFTVIGWPDLVSLVLAACITVPIMFVLVRLVIKTKNK